MNIPNPRRTVAMLGMAVLMSATSARATILLIDQFGDTQHLLVPPGTFDSNNVLGAMLGGFRYASITQTTGAPGSTDSMDVNSPIVNELDFHNQTGSIANLIFFYDGTNGTSGTPAFLLGADLTNGGANNQLDLGIESDHAVTVTVDVFSGLGTAQSEATYLLSNDSAFHTYSTLFSGFAPISGGGADFANVSTFEVKINGASQLDLAINGISTSGPAGVPEPATLGMMGAGLVGIGLISRRKRATKT